MTAEAKEQTMTQLVPIETAPRLNWINGTWNAGGAVRASMSPSNGRVLGHYVDIGHDEAQQAIQAARTAFDATGWPQERGLRSRALFELADRLQEAGPDIALMLSREGASCSPRRNGSCRVRWNGSATQPRPPCFRQVAARWKRPRARISTPIPSRSAWSA
ncbi:aldehyde dehydrogenase family protein [Pseudoroseomonas wenyumeiae]